MKLLRVIYNYILFLLNIRKILPREIISLIKVLENKERLVEITNSSRILVKTNHGENFLRERAYKCLVISSQYLPEGYSLLLLEAIRPKSRQQLLWNKEREVVVLQNPKADEAEINRLTSLRISAVGGSGHQTGGAVDVSLLFEGFEVDMGGKYLEFNSRTFTFSPELSNIQRNNRKILLSVMEKSGFKNFPAEWWHYSYGDRMWAAYSKKFTCFYGNIENL